MSWHRGTYTVPKKRTKTKNSIWGSGELGHSWCCLADQCLKTCHPDGSSSKQTPWWKHKHQKRWTHWGRTMSFAVVVPPTAPAKRWRSEMELPKSRAGNEHICNRSTSTQHLFLARGLFAGWRDSIEIAHALTSPKTSEDSFKRDCRKAELDFIAAITGPFTVPLCLFIAVLFWCEMCQLYCPGRGHSVRWFELSVKALPQRAMNMCLPPVVWGIPRNWGCCSNPARCTKSQWPKNLLKNTTPKKLPKNKHKGTSSAASNSCSCLNLSLVKGDRIWGGKFRVWIWDTIGSTS